MLLEKSQQLGTSIFDPVLCLYPEVIAEETPPHPFGLPEVQLRRDVLFHGRSCRRGKSGNRCRRKRLFEPGEFAVVFPKLMPPFTHAVRLINHEKVDRKAVEKGKEPFVIEPFGSNIQKPDLPGKKLCFDLPALVVILHRVEHRGGDTVGLQGDNLIMHECQQWRDDNRHALHQQCRELIAQRFTPTGREDHQDILLGKNRIDHLLLQRAESVVSEVMCECLQLVHGDSIAGKRFHPQKYVKLSYFFLLVR